MSENGKVLTRRERFAGRRRFLWFAIFNAASFSFLTGNLITLYLLRLGSSRTTVGIIASFGFAAFLVSLLGRELVPRFGLIRLFTLAWLLRYLFMIPAALAPLIFQSYGTTPAIVAVGVGSLGFHFFRGLGLVANAPVTGMLSDGPDRGAFLSSFQIRVAISAMLSSILIAVMVDPQASLLRYALLITGGIILGMVATAILSSLPEPPGGDAGRSKFREAIRRVRDNSGLGRFFHAFFVFAIAGGIYRSFLVVTAKQVYGFSDRNAFILTVIGFLGTLTMGVMSRLLTDRVGAKPMTMIFVSVIAVGTVPLLVLPGLVGISGFLLLGILFFGIMFGVTGGETTAQAYFLAMVPPRERLETGLFFFLALGLGGTFGSAAGGAVLDGLTYTLGFSIDAAFRTFYGLSFLLLLSTLLLFSRLERMGAYSFRSALGVLFSLRDLRAITLVQQLDEAMSLGADRKTLQRLGTTDSTIATEEILRALDSPSFVIRNDALYALADVRWTDAVEDALIAELHRNEYTTAHLAARLLGKRGTIRSVDPLRHALASRDYLLQAKAAVALARQRDDASFDGIVGLLGSSPNPLVVIHAAAALRLYDEAEGLAPLIRALGRREVDAYVADELILDAASLLGLERWFYKLYERFTRTPEASREELAELIPEKQPELLEALVAGAKGELATLGREETSAQGAGRNDPRRSIIVSQIEAWDTHPRLKAAISELDLSTLRYPARLLLLLLAARSVGGLRVD